MPLDPQRSAAPTKEFYDGLAAARMKPGDRVYLVVGEGHSERKIEVTLTLVRGQPSVVPIDTAADFVLLGPALRLDLRGVVDIQLGDVPFYELARYEDTFFGGANGIRGVPGQRYYGRIKLFGNVELRSRWFGFDVGGKTWTLGSAVFLDAGRLWSDFGSHPELDGTGLGFKVGLGGGIRLQQGEQFIVRLDVAWSPDARPVGLYVQAGQAF